MSKSKEKFIALRPTGTEGFIGGETIIYDFKQIAAFENKLIEAKEYVIGNNLYWLRQFKNVIENEIMVLVNEIGGTRGVDLPENAEAVEKILEYRKRSDKIEGIQQLLMQKYSAIRARQRQLIAR
jgi:hypothetical protein